jgi:16S rRNA (adenine1518-N6/adenine1519-N6)-dimethyltransferase
MDARSVILTRPREVREYLAGLDFHPGKSLGQNFLIDANMRDLILDASRTGSGDTVIEVGPGLGVMTEGLLDRAASVTAIELDARLVDHLRNRFGPEERLTLIHQDATETDWAACCRPDPVRVVSNLPYSVGSRILYDLADPEIAPLSITVMVQTDVADRMLATPGSDAYGLLSVRLGWMFEIERVRNVPGACFHPAPRVGSSVVHLTRRSTPPAPVQDPDLFERLVKFAFTRRRKQMGRILKEFGMQVDAEVLDLSRRPETLTLEEWAEVCRSTVPVEKISKPDRPRS